MPAILRAYAVTNEPAGEVAKAMPSATTPSSSFANISAKHLWHRALPNDIIMHIIREADGGFPTHKRRFTPCLAEIEFDHECYDDGGDEFFPDAPLDGWWYRDDYDFLRQHALWAATEMTDTGYGENIYPFPLVCWVLFNLNEKKANSTHYNPDQGDSDLWALLCKDAGLINSFD